MVIRHRGVGVMSRQRAQYLRRAIPRRKRARQQEALRGVITIPVDNRAFGYEAAAVVLQDFRERFPDHEIRVQYIR